MSDTIRVSVLGQEYVLEKGTPIMELADRLQEHYDADIVMAEYNDRLIELHKKLKEDGNITFITTVDKNGRRAYRRSLVMLMQAAVEEMYPQENANVKVMHSLGDGYYCKWEDERPVTEAFVTALKQKMNEMVAADLPIMKDVMKTRNAKKMFAERGMNDKVRLLRYRSSSNINIYDLHGSKDYFYGYMVASTKYLKYFDVVPFDEGFMLLFPDKKDGKTMAPFDPATKLFSVMQESIHWGKMM
ncbi:MAG: nucleoside kinase, partial [Lachnospiraceae bacterium]|nr:nucleoside kinase [Lachnospiraceae bacterium]